MSFFLIPLLRSRIFTNRLIILSTLAPNHFLSGDGPPICSGHGAVFFCSERPSKLRGMEGWQSHMEQGPLGQMKVIKAASPSHGGDKSSIYEPLSNFTALSSPNRHLWEQQENYTSDSRDLRILHPVLFLLVSYGKKVPTVKDQQISALPEIEVSELLGCFLYSNHSIQREQQYRLSKITPVVWRLCLNKWICKYENSWWRGSWMVVYICCCRLAAFKAP